LREIQQRIRQYELMAVFSPDVTEEDLPGAIDRVSGYITIAGGEIVSINQESPWGRRRLAYAIRYQGRDVRDGYYVLYYFDIQSTQIAEIEHEIGLNDKLIRHILTIRGEIPVVVEPEEGAEGEASPAEGSVAAVTAAPVAESEPKTAEVAAQTEEAPVEVAADAVEAPIEAAAETVDEPAEIAAPEVVEPGEAAAIEEVAEAESTEK